MPMKLPDMLPHIFDTKITLSIFENADRKTLSKHLTLSTEGEVVKSAAAELVQGRVRRLECASVGEVCSLMQELQPYEAAAFGVCEYDEALVLSRRRAEQYQGNEVMVTRTRENFYWPEGAGVIPFDYDPPPGAPAKNAEELVQALRKAVPELCNVTLAVKPSASSCIYSQDGKELRGIRGQHGFAIVKDAREIPDIGNIVADRLWLADYGYIAITKNGNLLERTIIDTSVFQPERLIFGRAECGDGLIQRFPAPYLSPGTLDGVIGEGWIEPKSIPDLTADEHARVLQLKDDAKALKADEAKDIRKKWIESRADEAARREGKDKNPEAVAALREQFRKAAEEGEVLPPDLILYPQDGGTITVAEVMADPDKWDGKQFADPIDPTYGNDPRIAIAVFKNTREPYIYSHAHGGTRYYFQSIDACDEFETAECGGEPKEAKKCDFSLGFDPTQLPGLIGDTVRWILSTSDQPRPDFALLNTLAFAGAVFGRRYESPMRTRTNIYIVGTGETGAGKNHSRKEIIRLAKEAGLLNFLGGHSLRSDTGMLRGLMRHGCQLLMLDEFGYFLQTIGDKKAASHHRMIMRAFIMLYSDSNGMYHHGDYADVKNSPIVIDNPNLCIFGTTTESQYIPALSKSAIESGELNRFIVLPMDSSKRPLLRNTPSQNIPEELIKAWQVFSAAYPNPPGGIVGNDIVGTVPIIVPWGECNDLQYKIRSEQNDKQYSSSATRALWIRFHENTIKIALIMAIGRNAKNTAFCMEDFIMAEKIVRTSILYMENLAENHMAESPYEAQRNEILNFLKRQRIWIPRTKISKKFCNIKGRELDEHLADMVAQEVIIAEQVNERVQKGGKPRTSFKYKG